MAQSVITEEQAGFYHDNGYLILPGALEPEELARVQRATADLVATARPGAPDTHFQGDVLARIEYVVDKRPELRALLAHPFILRTTQKLMGPDLLPTWDAMVVKMPGEGVAVPWHRDAATDCVGNKPIFNVDFYLDAATQENCVWVVPGSHHWDKASANAWCAQHRRAEQSVETYRGTKGALPVFMRPGDVLLHDILVVHGSPRTTAAALRRVIYYEFRTAQVEAELGPHTPQYIPLKQAVLHGAINARRRGGFALTGEESFRYAPPAPFDTVAPSTEPPTYRYLHTDYWRQ